MGWNVTQGTLELILKHGATHRSGRAEGVAGQGSSRHKGPEACAQGVAVARAADSWADSGLPDPVLPGNTVQVGQRAGSSPASREPEPASQPPTGLALPLVTGTSAGQQPFPGPCITWTTPQRAEPGAEPTLGPVPTPPPPLQNLKTPEPAGPPSLSLIVLPQGQQRMGHVLGLATGGRRYSAGLNAEQGRETQGEEEGRPQAAPLEALADPSPTHRCFIQSLAL